MPTSGANRFGQDVLQRDDRMSPGWWILPSALLGTCFWAVLISQALPLI